VKPDAAQLARAGAGQRMFDALPALPEPYYRDDASGIVIYPELHRLAYVPGARGGH
jgi:hypothetical protein